MTTPSKYRLADSTVIEPLVHNWHAWSHLLSPLTAGFHLLNYQCHTMKSYIDDPESHVRACSDPALKGGPFVNIPIERAAEVRQLLDDTIVRRGRNMELARAVVSYYNKLVNEARGQSIEPYYESLPAALQGYVELVYDYYDRPILRVLEGLLYESSYYDESLQSLRLFRLEDDATRDFFMSTPRLHEAGEINWPTPFAADRVDWLFRLEREFHPLGYIKELLGLETVSETTLKNLLTQDAIAPKAEPDRSLLRLRYYGHATVLVEWNGVAILTDPCIPVMPHGGGIARYSYHDLPDRIDFALVTHSHHDHLVLETLLRLRNRIGCLIVPKSNGLLYGDTSLKLMAKKLGIGSCLEFDPLDSVDFPGGEIIGVPFLGEHSDIAHSKVGYIVRAGKERILFAADSACLDESIYKNLRRVLGPIQTVFLGMECVGAPLTWHSGWLLPKAPEYHHDQSRRSHGCDAAGGLRLLEILEASRFYNYAMGLEPWFEFLLGLGLTEASTQIQESNRLLRKARGRGLLAAERLFAKRDIYLPNRPAASRPHSPLNGRGPDEHTSDQQDCAQPNLWFLMASDPDPLFSISSALARVSGRLDPDALECALRKVISRHTVFASAVAGLKDSPGADAGLAAGMELKVADLTELSAEAAAGAACTLLWEQQGQPLDVNAGPSLRVCLVSLPAGKHNVVVTGHRLFWDSRTLGLLLAEVAEAYAKLITQDAPPRQPSPNRGKAGLPFDGDDRGDAPVVFSSSNGKTPFADPVRITGSLLDGAARLCAETGCDLSIILLAAFQVMVQAIETGEEVEVRAIIEDPGSQAPIASPFSALRLVTDTSGNLGFAQFAKRVRQVAERATQTQKVAGEPAANLSREFDVVPESTLRPVFIIKRKFQSRLSWPDGVWSLADLLPVRAESSLLLCLYRDAAGLSGVLRYDETALNSGPPGDLGNKYEAILREVALNPGKPLRDLSGHLNAPDRGTGIGGLDLDQQFDFLS